MGCTTAFDAEDKIQRVLCSNCDNSNIITSNDRGIFFLITRLVTPSFSSIYLSSSWSS